MYLSKKGLLVLGVSGLILGSLAFSTTPSNEKIVSEQKSLTHRDSGIIVAKKTPHPLLSPDLYQKALQGYKQILNYEGLRKSILTIVDFSKPSSEKRMFIIDMNSEKVLMHTYVAHGKNSGEIIANRFSNTESSYQSSLGFFLTGTTYQGSNGYSLKLKGLEKGFNDRAEKRAIVMHGAPYVSEEIIRRTGRLGRSWGCPAVSQKEHKQIIDLIKNGSCLFIYAPEKTYMTSSNFLNESIDSNMVM